MSGMKSRSSRRAFFLNGGAVLGAGVATTVGASALASKDGTSVDEQLRQVQRQIECAADCEAIRKLHLRFTSLMQEQSYDAAADLFNDEAHLSLSGLSATGQSAIRRLLAGNYRDQNAPAIHSAYRQNPSQQKDEIALSEDRLQASGTFHIEVELCTPLQADCTAAEMARLQGNVADRRWEAGRFEAKYVKTRGEWKMASLSYLAS